MSVSGCADGCACARVVFMCKCVYVQVWVCASVRDSTSLFFTYTYSHIHFPKFFGKFYPYIYIFIYQYLYSHIFITDEWQLAAQGLDGRKYPWGGHYDPSRIPPVCRQRSNCLPCNVTSHPRGVSPYGVLDLVGNVWQYTADEFADEHTRRVVLRGGSYYEPAAISGWYFPQAKDLWSHNTMLLMDDSYERTSTVGFRCVMDA